MDYRAFCCCHATGDEVESAKPVAMDRDTIISTAMQVLREEGDFFGVVDTAGVTLQFVVEADGSVHMEVPRPQDLAASGFHDSGGFLPHEFKWIEWIEVPRFLANPSHRAPIGQDVAPFERALVKSRAHDVATADSIRLIAYDR